MLSACARDQPGLLDQSPIKTQTLNVEFMRLANCAYRRLDKTEGTGIKKVDLVNESRLALESGGVRYWELTFTSLNKAQTRVDFSVVTTMWGADTSSAERIMREVGICAR